MVIARLQNPSMGSPLLLHLLKMDLILRVELVLLVHLLRKQVVHLLELGGSVRH